MGKRREEKFGWIEGLRGPAQWRESDARRVLDALAESGETLSGFARRHGLTPQRLSWWRRRLGEWTQATQGTEPLQAGPCESGFIPVLTRGNERSWSSAVAVVRVGNVAIEIHELSDATTAWLATFVEALGARA